MCDTERIGSEIGPGIMQDHDHDPALDQARASIELQQLLLETEDLTGFLDEVAGYAAATVAPGVLCGITMQRDGLPMTAASNGPLALDLDEVQYGHHEGPCLKAMRSGGTVLVTDLATDTRFGDYQSDALAHGVVSALAVALDAGPDAGGALNLYATQAGVFTPARQEAAQVLAEEVSRALRLAVRLTDQVRLTRHLETAMASRSIIDQAIGVIMAQDRCTPTEAFEVLRRASNHRNVKLREVASTIVAGMSGPPPATRTDH